LKFNCQITSSGRNTSTMNCKNIPMCCLTAILCQFSWSVRN
jgi:hypothetical protein